MADNVRGTYSDKMAAQKAAAKGELSVSLVSVHEARPLSGLHVDIEREVR